MYYVLTSILGHFCRQEEGSHTNQLLGISFALILKSIPNTLKIQYMEINKHEFVGF